jgi:hypothetical protein
MKTKVTFSFSKLSKKLDTLLPQTERRNLRDVADQFKKNIQEGKFKPLAPATQKRRKYKGYNPHYPRTKPRDTKTPLIATGNLLKSIRVTKKGVTFNKYGDYHIKGGSNLPRRNWMKLKSQSKPGGRIMSDKNLKMFRREIRKGFKLSGRGKNIRNMRF